MSTATDMLAAYIDAEQRVLVGQVVVWQGRSLTRADLAEIRAGRQEWQARVDAEAAARAGRYGPRHLVPDFTGFP